MLPRNQTLTWSQMEKIRLVRIQMDYSQEWWVPEYHCLKKDIQAWIHPNECYRDGGHFYELPRHQPRMYEEDERHNPISNSMDGLYSSEQIEKFGDGDMRRKKCHILDCVLDTFPEHLKAKAKSMCDTLKCKDRLFILPSHEIIIDGEVDRGSNIRD